MTDTITISSGAQVDIEPGVYEVTLIAISEPRTIFPQSGPNAGKEVNLRDWEFALEDDTVIRGGASTASGPKSKTYAWLTALLGGTPPAVGQSYPKDQLIGRMALATIAIDESGWPRIANLSALPKARATAPVAPEPVVEAPVAVAAAPVRRAAARPVAGDDALPF